MEYRFVLLRWLATAFFTGLQIATVKIYQAKGNFTSAQKTALIFIMFVLAMLLSNNFLESFKELAKALKPTLKKRTQEGSKEWRLIDQLDSLLKVWGLLLEVRNKPGLTLLGAFSVFWLCLNLAAQAAVTGTNLIYQVNDGTNYKDTYTRPGTVNVPDLSCYKDNFHDACGSQVAIQTIAHSYGETILAFDPAPFSYNESADILQCKELYRYFHRTTPSQQQVAYRFNEYNPNDTEKIYPRLTNRTIYAEARNCITYNQTSSDDSDPLTYADEVTGEIGNITIPKPFRGREGTTYIYRGFHDPSTAPLQSCGDRCLWMWAYRNPSRLQEQAAFYKCPVNISIVFNALNLMHEIPNDVVKMSAAAIALHGGYQGPPSNVSEQDYTSYQFYAAGSPWDIHGHTSDYVGDRFAFFALGSLSTMANLNPLVLIPGDRPYLGHRIEINEPSFAILWACIVGAHLVIFIATVISRPRVEQAAPEQELDSGIMDERVAGNESQERLV